MKKQTPHEIVSEVLGGCVAMGPSEPWADSVFEALWKAGYLVVPMRPEGHPCLRDDLHDYVLKHGEAAVRGGVR